MGKIKQFIENEKGKDALIVVIVILVGLGSFELGRLSKESGSPGIEIEYTDAYTASPANVVSASESVNTSAVQNSNTTGLPAQTGKYYFASSRGSKDYTLGCSAGKTIKHENRVYFDTKDEAEQAGYTLSTSCN